jgi:hypothetical protein
MTDLSSYLWKVWKMAIATLAIFPIDLQLLPLPLETRKSSTVKQLETKKPILIGQAVLDSGNFLLLMVSLIH